MLKMFLTFFSPFFPPLRSFQWSPIISVVSICEWDSVDYIETILERHTQKRISVESDDEKMLGSTEYELRIISKKKKKEIIVETKRKKRRKNKEKSKLKKKVRKLKTE